MCDGIVEAVDLLRVESRVDSWSPPMTLETLHYLPKVYYVDCGELRNGRHGTLCPDRARLGLECAAFVLKFQQQDELQPDDSEQFARNCI
jgi:hypothetical protein